MTMSLSYGMPKSNPVQEELISKLEEENKVLVEELDKMKKEQEELLELLAEQDNKINDIETQLQQAGTNVSFFQGTIF